ncbi:MAG: DUF2911 domain-containing protein [Acidobacteria bacterium]|nr:MAG: DUF2911 domain-containing protein [Acidobacteriota bacterium]REJ98090.1 MAG: DUF2911 domain-containing protein [Acidobacteriota bacterium]REK16833.1 MAG: DUF2911 domain-containing protein [Acidobacteriota bacterium]REK42744.1 MAG: DUF2911 domain-containing protein [Acidobacteriota bacterium]
MRLNKLVLILMVFVLGTGAVFAQGERPASPRGEASTQIGGKWIVVDYGRPILRGRRGVFGPDQDYGKKLYAGAPVWRLGANKSTRINTEIDLMFGDKKLPAGEYSMFAELGQSGWTLIFSNHAAKNTGRGPGEGIWGAYNYDSSKDVIRVPMRTEMLQNSIDQFTIVFMDVTENGGVLGFAWDNVMGGCAFTVETPKAG